MGKKETRHGVGVRVGMKGLVVQFHLYQGFTPLGPGSSIQGSRDHRKHHTVSVSVCVDMSRHFSGWRIPSFYLGLRMAPKQWLVGIKIYNN